MRSRSRTFLIGFISAGISSAASRSQEITDPFASSCESCHNADALSSDNEIPSLADTGLAGETQVRRERVLRKLTSVEMVPPGFASPRADRVRDEPIVDSTG